MRNGSKKEPAGRLASAGMAKAKKLILVDLHKKGDYVMQIQNIQLNLSSILSILHQPTV